jgi:hypothetical protein
MRSLLFTTFLAASLSVSAVASAQPSKAPAPRSQGDARTDQARELHVKGAALFEQGQYEKAEAAFLAAWALKKHYQLASNLGACEMKLGRYRDAAEHLAFFLREQPPTGNQDDRKRTQALFEQARAKVGAVVLTVNVEGAVVSVDGREIGAAPFTSEVYVDPGPRTFVATHGSYRDAKEVIEAKAGGTQPVRLKLTGLTGPDPLPPPPKRSVVPGVVMSAAAGAGVIAGIGLLAGAGSKASSASDMHDAIAKAGHTCTAGAPTFDSRCDQLKSTTKTADTLHSVGVGGLVVGGVVAAGAITYFLWPQRSAANATQQQGALRLLPIASPNGGGLLLVGTY